MTPIKNEKKELNFSADTHLFRVLGKEYPIKRPNDPTIGDPAMVGRWMINYGYKNKKTNI